MVEVPTNSSKKYTNFISNIEKGFQMIGTFEKEPTLVLLGNSGVGKTALAACLAGHKLKIVKKSHFCLELENPCDNLELKISHAKKSETKFPVKVRSPEGIVIFDTPGFFDTENEGEFCNAFYLQRIFETREALHFVFVVSDSFFNERGTKFIESVDRLCAIFKNPTELGGCLSLVVSKIDTSERNEKEILQNIEDVLEQNLQENIKIMINFLKDSVFLFPKQRFSKENTGGNEYKAPNFKGLIQKEKFLKPEQGCAIGLVSEKCKVEFINRFLENLHKITNKMEVVCGEILAKGQNLRKGIEKDDFFKKLLGKIEFDQITNLFSLETLIIFNKFFKYALKPKKSDDRLFFFTFEKGIVDIFKVFHKFSLSESEERQIKAFYSSVIDNTKILDFLEKVCGKSVCKELYSSLKDLEIASSKFNQLEQKADSLITSLVIDAQIDLIQYYELVYSVLSSCENDLKISENQSYFWPFLYQNIEKIDCSKQKAFSKFRMGEIHFKAGQKSIALKQLIESFRLDDTNLSTISTINKICSSSPELLKHLTSTSEWNIWWRLYKINTVHFNEFLENFKNSLNNFMEKNRENHKVKVMVLIDEIFETQKELDKAETFADWDKLEHIINQIMEKLQQSDQKPLSENFSYMIKIFSEIQPNDEFLKTSYLHLNQVVSQLKSINIENYLCSKIINFPVEIFSKENKDPQDYQDLISLTQKFDPEFKERAKNIRFEAFHVIATIFLEKKEYQKAFSNNISALHENPRFEKALRQITEIYNTWKEMEIGTIPQHIRISLLEFNIQEFRKIINDQILSLLVEFKETKEKNCPSIPYLRDLRQAFHLIALINKQKDYSHLIKLFEIRENQMKLDVQYLSSPEKNRFTLQRAQKIIDHFNYIVKLNGDSPTLLKKCFEDDKGHMFLGTEQENRAFLLQQISNFILDEKEECPKYFLEFIQFNGKDYQQDIKIMSLVAKAKYKLATLQKEIELYLEAKETDDIFRKLSRNSVENRNFYVKESKILEIYKEIAHLYKKSGNLAKALEYFEWAGNFIEIRSILKEIEVKYFLSPQIYIKIGDYYKNVALINNAIKNYQKAASFANHIDDLAEIEGKIVNALKSVGPEGPITMRFTQRKQLLEQKLDFFIDQPKVFEGLDLKDLIPRGSLI